ncbi:MAG: putative aminopeptidase [Acidobacteria bacterium]|nr:putative aminopeptidase [Acidobacteriota bacterium]
MKRALALALGLPLLLPSSSPALPQAATASYTVTAVKQPAFRAAADGITAAQLKDYLSYVASDEMEGRDTPSRGLDATAKFIATLLSRWGVKPAGDQGSYFQRIELAREKPALDALRVEIGKRALSYGTDFLAVPAAGEARGGLVFAGDGWYVKARKIDAYANVDPKGKIVIVTQGGFPPGVSRDEIMSLGKRGEDWMDPSSYARKKGAVGIIMLPTLLNQANPERVAQIRRRFEDGQAWPEKLPRGEGSFGAADPLPTVYLLARGAQALFAGEKSDAATILQSFPAGTPVAPFALSDQKQAVISIKTTKDRLSSQNVVGVVEGSDPSLKSEYVAFGAHYDHDGTRPGEGDTIMNGADDDGSGTVALLAMAEALQKAPRKPKRSAIFVWHMGEEHGLWGSSYFAAFPTVPIDRIVAQLNIDMIGRSRAAGDTDPRDKDLSGPNEVYVIGSRMMSTELGALSDAVNAAYEKLSYNFRYDDPKDPERFFYRSDHVEYARRGIPIIFYFTGVHRDYHQPSDEVSKIDFAKYERITRAVFATFWEIADRKARLVVDKKLELPAEGF